MMEDNLSNRIVQYNRAILVFVIFLALLMSVFAISLISTVNWLILLSCCLLMLLIIVHNFFYFRKLDYYEILRRSFYALPLVALILGITIALIVSIRLNIIFPQAFTDLWIRLIVFAFLTFLLGLAALTIPLTRQQRFLQVDAKKSEYQKLKAKIDTVLIEITQGMVIEFKPSPIEVEQELRNIDMALKGFFLVSYREVVESETKANYFQYLSPFIGPVVAIILFFIGQIIK
jgi:hypothetical protein